MLVSLTSLKGTKHLPSAEVISRKVYHFPRLVPGVYLGVYNMCLVKLEGKKIVHMGWEALEA